MLCLLRSVESTGNGGREGIQNHESHLQLSWARNETGELESETVKEGECIITNE